MGSKLVNWLFGPAPTIAGVTRAILFFAFGVVVGIAVISAQV